MESVVIGGVDLSPWYRVVNVRRPLPKLQSKITHVSGADGYAYGGADLLPGSLSFTLVAIDKSNSGLRAAARALAPVLLKKGPQEVSFSSDDGLYYRCVQQNDLEFGEHVRSASLDVSLQPLDVFMRGTRRTFTVPSGGSVTFNVGGTYPTAPKILSTSTTRDSGSGVWGLRLDEGDFIRVPFPSAVTSRIEIDCEERTVRKDYVAVLPTLDSDWLEFEPGEHTLRMDKGAGTVTVEYEERWL